MLIFIDESGSFSPTPSPHRVCCVAALVVPETFAATLFRRFRKLTRTWRCRRREIKGSELSERQMADVLALLRRFDVLVFAECVDMGIHGDAIIQRHKDGQAEALERSAARVVAPVLAQDIRDLAANVRALSNPLYVQSVMLTGVAERVLSSGSLYYAQRLSRTLGAFRWRIDAKDRKMTPSERLWVKIVKPLMQTRSLSEPTPALEGADYSAFEKFTGALPEAPDHLRDQLPRKDQEGPFHFVDLNKLMADMRFRRSHHLTGIQLADIVASAITRACNGTLQPEGWRGVGRLMLQNEKGKHALRFIALSHTEVRGVRVPYHQVARVCDRDCKRMVAGVSRVKSG